MGFMDEFKKSLYDEPDGDIFMVAGRKVVCLHCGYDHFDLATAKLNTTGMSLLGLDWLNRNYYVLICEQCGRIENFIDEPEAWTE